MPLVTGGTGEEVGRARGKDEVPAFEAAVGARSAEAEFARGKKRNSGNFVEDALIHVPADAGAGGVFSDEDVLEGGGVEPRECGYFFAQVGEEVWDVVGLLKAGAFKVIAPAEGDDASLSREAVEAEFLEAEGLDLADQFSFFEFGNQGFAEEGTFGKGGLLFEEIQLVGGGHDMRF